MISMKRYTRTGIIAALMIISVGFTAIVPLSSYAASQQSQAVSTATVLPITSIPTATSIPTQTPVPAVVPTVLPTGDRIPFSSLAQQDKLLYGPSDSTSFSFGVPAEWVLQQRAKLQLNLTVFVPGAESATANQSYAGSLMVTFNNQLLGQVSLNRAGDIVATLDIPIEALNLVQRDGRYNLAFEFDSGLNCISNLQMNVLIRSSSLMILPHSIVALPTDLNLFPRPIIQRSFLPDTVIVVVPDAPSAAELQAAMVISAGFGRMSNGRALLSLVPQSQLNDDMRKANHIVLVGKAEALTAFDSKFNILTSATIIGKPAATADDGIVQMLISPWNPAYAVLLVTGTSDAGIIKASQALSSGQIRPIEQPNLAIISSIEQSQVSPPSDTTINRTLAELGYAQRVMRNSGAATTFKFFIPADRIINGDAYFDLWFSHSGQLDFGRSNASLLLNDQPVGGLTLSQDTTRLTRVRFGLPRSAMRTGTNELKIDATLLRSSGCYMNDGSNGLWMAIMPESTLVVPLGAGNGVSTRLYDLSFYPSMFLVEPNMSTLALIVAQQDIAGWKAASQLAFNLGTRNTSSFSKLALAYADAIPEDVRTTRDLMLIGRPSTLPTINEMKDHLPIPFEPGSDLALERNTRVQYRIAPGASIGYLELFQSPWNPARGVLAILGSDNPGVIAAANALILPEQRGRLNGSLAIIDGQQIISASTLSSLQLANGATPVVQESNVIDSEAPFERPAWLISAIIALAGVLVALLLGILIVSLRRRQVGIR